MGEWKCRLASIGKPAILSKRKTRRLTMAPPLAIALVIAVFANATCRALAKTAKTGLFGITSRISVPSMQAFGGNAPEQGDPRGCALYILRPGDVPAGEAADAYYSRGLAVY